MGGVWLPGRDPAQANRPTQLLRDYDALVYIPRVTADEAPVDRLVIPTRGRRVP